MKAYLDNDIVIKLERELIDLEKLKNAIKADIKLFPYSDAHLYEIEDEVDDTSILKNEEIQNLRFKTINKMSNNNFLGWKLPEHKMYLLDQEPSEVWEVLPDVRDRSMMQALIELLSPSQKKRIRDEIGIDQNRIEDYSPNEVIEHLNKPIRNFEKEGSILEIFDHALTLNKEGQKISILGRIISLFDLLNMLGYWKAEGREERRWASRHVFFGSVCDYFISGDARTRNKAEVVFQILGAKTKILNSRGN